MAFLYPNSSAQLDVLSAPYVHDQNTMMYLNPTSMAAHESMQSISGRLNTRTGDTAPHQLASRSQLSIIDGEQNSHGLSLSLSTQMPTALPQPSFQHQFSNSERIDSRNSAHGSYDLDGNGQISVSFGAPDNLKYSLNPNTFGYASTVLKSRYLKAAQQLLDEVVNVREALKQHESVKVPNTNKAKDGSTESKEENVPALNVHESTAVSSQEISATELQDLQNKLDQLLALSDEVDRRYKHYHHQMQIVVSSLDSIAGVGAAKPYTTLALKTISRHFRCLRDTISVQIQANRKGLGDQDSGQGGSIPRLRYVDEQLRQQRALQQFGIMRDAWRSQRGLPENAVTILRAWLFEHFLHPYPKDSEKIMLARQTGLTRSQVANWFINARVRLWKPMVEEMYKEEFGNADINSKLSPENASKATGEKSWTTKDMREDLQESVASMAESNLPGPSHDESTEPAFTHRDDDHQPGLDTHGFYPHNQNSLMGYQYQVPEPGSYGVENRVSLALGLRGVEGEDGHVSTGDFSYLDPVNQQNRFGSSHLLKDFVA